LKEFEKVQRFIHNKADIEKVQELVSEIRVELVTQVKEMKKDMLTKKKKKEEEGKKQIQELAFTNEKALEEMKTLKEKLQKVANQFDKELSQRDKNFKLF